MVDPIAVAEQIVNLALFINDQIQEVKYFKEQSRRLLFQIDQITPSLESLVKMKDDKEKLQQKMQQDTPEATAFVKSLDHMLQVMTEIKEFTTKLEGKGQLAKMKSKDKYKGKFEDFEHRLNVLQNSLMLGVITEVKKDTDKDGGTEESRTVDGQYTDEGKGTVLSKCQYIHK